MGKTLVIVAIRSNVQWLEMNKEKFFAQGDTPITRSIFMPQGKWLNKHWQYIKFWDQMLNSKYFVIRNRMQKLAEKSHAKIKNLDLVIKGKEAIFNFTRKYRNDSWIMLPVDDDDFFHPEVANKSLEAYNSADVINWNTTCFDTSKTIGKRLVQMSNSILPSNGYAITDKVVKKLPPKITDEMISRHCTMLSFINKNSLTRKTILENLALYNKNPLSFSSTRKKTMKREVIQDYFSGVRKSLKEEVNNYPHDWVYPYVNQIKKVLTKCF